MVFEVGKCYEHETGMKMRIIGETDRATYMPVGQTEHNTVNWTECKDFAEN